VSSTVQVFTTECRVWAHTGEMITRSFEIHSRRLGFNERQTTEGRLPTTFRRPSSQGRLFE
jgi:hypothetical protein